MTKLTTEHKCRIICMTNKVNPDADAHDMYQNMPGFKRDEFGRVLQWMTWITTVETERTISETDKGKEERKKNLQRIIDETGRNGPRYSCYDEQERTE